MITEEAAARVALGDLTDTFDTKTLRDLGILLHQKPKFY